MSKHLTNESAYKSMTRGTSACLNDTINDIADLFLP